MEKINFIPFYVYIHTFPNKKVYIGITHQNPNRRWRNNGEGYRKQNFIYNAIKKYGWENVKHEILYTNLTKEETKAKMRKAKLGKKMSLETKMKKGKAVIMLDRNFNYINEFYSITEAHNKTNTNLTNIHECCNKKRPTAGGYIWRYKEGEMTY